MPRPLDYVAAAQPRPPVSWLAAASLLASLSPLLACPLPWAYAPLDRVSAWCALAGPPVGVLAGVVALARLRRRGGRGTGLAVAGVTTGAVLCAMIVFVELTGAGGP
jgi:hypothetical protein